MVGPGNWAGPGMTQSPEASGEAIPPSCPWAWGRAWGHPCRALHSGSTRDVFLHQASRAFVHSKSTHYFTSFILPCCNLISFFLMLVQVSPS